ncbi:MAG: hypothetical protein R6X34_28150 [Chloroflexota bacterium]
MKENKKNTLATVLFLFGMLLALLLVVMSFWPDMEARLFDPGQVAEARLTTLRCPMVVTPADEAQITATFRNTLDRDLRLLVVARISEGRLTMMREARTLLSLPPGSKEMLAWDIAPEDAVFGRVIMARVHQFRSFPYPSRDKVCGVLFLNLPWLTGGQLVWMLSSLTLLSLGVGAWLWLRQERPLSEARRRRAINVGVLTAVLFAAFLAGLLGVWLVSLLLLGFMLLLFVSMLESGS